MKTLKKGCKDDEVFTLQHALNITADGVFGPATERAVKQFQIKHGLEADGIVGPMTWAALGFNTTKAVDPSVVYLPLSVHVTKSPGRAIRYLAIHYTAGSSSAPGRARAIKHVFEQRQASADFAVDDSEIVQFNRDPRNYFCWAVGDRKDYSTDGGRLYGVATNRNTISIEICSTLAKGASVEKANHDGWSYTEAAIENAVKLANILMAKYDIPIERVVRHYDISGKLCPGIVGWNNGRLYTMDGKATTLKNNSAKWEAFKKRLL